SWVTRGAPLDYDRTDRDPRRRVDDKGVRLPRFPGPMPSGGFVNMVGPSAVAVLERPTLVLNKLWQPVHVATVARSLTLLWNEAAHVVDPEDFRLYNWSGWSQLAPREGEP